MARMMTERTSDILCAAIREFVKSGDPVSSGRLYEQYDFGIKPAMIRAELACLEGNGYLEQPHHSAGRVPSDLGFEFFTSRMLEDGLRASVFESLAELLKTRAWEAFLDDFSRRFRVVGVAGSEHDRHVHKRGLEYLVANFLDSGQKSVTDIVHDIESIDEQFGTMKELFPEEDILKVFIGKKSPCTRSTELALMVGDCIVDGERVFIAAIGPKRMDYEKVAKVLIGFKQYNY